MYLNFSIIIPVYNRPDEIAELLDSLSKQTFTDTYEIVIVEDGSTHKCDLIIKAYKDQLDIKYLFKSNTGAGLSRNFGMKNALGNYFIILDSDVILPPTYLSVVSKELSKNYTDAYGGPDAAHKNFSTRQKAINYAMTSFLTTGGLRGGKQIKSDSFQPRSFNMGLSKKAFNSTGGYSNRKIGEDIDLSFRLWKFGYKTQLLSEAFVYHKRRNTFLQFFKQTYNFGKERPKLNREYPDTTKLTYWFPSVFVLGSLTAVVLLFFGCFLPLFVLLLYTLLIGIDSGIKNRSFRVGVLSIIASFIQFYGYGIGFLKGYFNK